MRRLALLIAAALALGVLAASAGAFMTGSARVSTGAAATTLPPGPSPTITVRGRAVAIRWPAATLASGDPVPGYAIVRYAATVPDAPVPAGGDCAGVVTATACTDAGVPAGAWRYAVVPRAGNAWQGPTGALSEVAVVAAAGASATPSLLGASPRDVIVDVTGFEPEEQIELRLDDPDDGPLLAPTPVAVDTGGAATVSTAIPLIPDGSHAIHVVGANGTRAVATIRSDATAPTTSDSTAEIGEAWTAQAQTVRLVADDGPDGSGAIATHWTIDGAPPTPQSPQGSEVTLTADGIHVLRYLSIDAAGNHETARTAATAIRIDRTAPTAGALTTPGAIAVAGSLAIGRSQVLTTTAVDPVVQGASSGIARVEYHACAGTCTPSPGAPGTVLIGASAIGPSYSLAWDDPPADGRYRLMARATDHAGTSSGSAVVERIVDTGGPTIAATLADVDANQAGFINRKDTFRAYANATDAGVGVDTATVTADLSAQCGSACGSVPLSSVGGPFTVLTPSGTVTYAYRSAVKTASPGAGGAFSVRAADLLGAVGAVTGAAGVDTTNTIGAPASVTLATGRLATGHASCPITPNGAINAQHAGAQAVHVVTAPTAPAGGVVVLTATSGSQTLTFARVVAEAGARTVVFDGLDLRALDDGTVTLSAVELSAGGSATSRTTTQSVTKLTATPTVSPSALVYADNPSPAPDRASSTLPVGPPRGFLAFTQTAGTRVGTTYVSPELSATGALGGLDLADEQAGPTYAITAVDVACNPSAPVTWSPTAVR